MKSKLHWYQNLRLLQHQLECLWILYTATTWKDLFSNGLMRTNPSPMLKDLQPKCIHSTTCLEIYYHPIFELISNYIVHEHQLLHPASSIGEEMLSSPCSDFLK
eukprot:m.74818 g.74818  ORF g.74818 m.74818 type:complete len:104 (-) comp13951_c0_seq2:530-841(-)